MGQESALFEEGVKGGYFLKRANGDVWQWDMWQPGTGTWWTLRIRRRAAWFKDRSWRRCWIWESTALRRTLVSGFRQTAVYYDGSDPVKMHNYYTYMYNKTVHDVIAKKKGEKEAILFARSATAGGQKFPVHWGGDCWSDYESMEESLRGGLVADKFRFWLLES